MSRYAKSLVLITGILIVDQVSKYFVKTGMTLGEEIRVFGNWFIIHFIENNGMAFGMEMGGESGKIILSLFRLVAIAAITWYLVKLIRGKAPNGLIMAISLVLAGAIGNMIDSAFYGLIFSESTPFETAVLFPEGGGYSSFLHGKVVDMLYFPVIRGVYPEWFPFWGGESFIFFRPVFNLSDACITTGVLMILVFQKRYFK
ncbi:MAG TPA: lipoprotein signal peptidase [Bacteroidetes bacterium]|nr:lipoprotein signal peptidase [Bacteroidota bacterium]